MMELGSFPAELRKFAIEIGQVLKMEMFPEDRVKPKPGKESKPKRFVIITFPFVALWKGIEKLAGIDESSCGTSDEDTRELAIERRWLMKKVILSAAGFLAFFAIIIWTLPLFDIYDWKVVGWLSLAALALTVIIATRTKFFDPPKAG